MSRGRRAAREHTMRIETDTVVALELEIADLEGRELLRSEAERPMVYLHGRGTLSPGLERALEGESPGAEVDVTLPPADAFGEHDPERVEYLDRSRFPADAELEIGQQFGAHDEQGAEVVLWITGIEGDQVTVNANHPLAGHTLRFRARVVAVRAATDAERRAGRPLEEGGGA